MHVLHGDVVGDAVGRGGAGRGLAEVEHLDDVGVRQAHGELGLVDEHVHEVLAERELRQDALDDEDLLEALDAVALGLEDLRHPALPEAFEQAVAAKCGVHGTSKPSEDTDRPMAKATTSRRRPLREVDRTRWERAAAARDGGPRRPDW